MPNDDLLQKSLAEIYQELRRELGLEDRAPLTVAETEYFEFLDSLRR